MVGSMEIKIGKDYHLVNKTIIFRKFILKKYYNSTKNLMIADNEMNILEQISDLDYVPKIIKEYIDNRGRYILLNKIEGRTLSDIYVINKIRAYDQIYEKVQELHKRNIYHNDIKEDNILLQNNKIYLIDFALSNNKYITTNNDTDDIALYKLKRKWDEEIYIKRIK